MGSLGNGFRQLFVQLLEAYLLFAALGLLQVGKDVSPFLSVGEGYYHIFHVAALCGADILEDRDSLLAQLVQLMLIIGDSFLVKLFCQLVDGRAVADVGSDADYACAFARE